MSADVFYLHGRNMVVHEVQQNTEPWDALRCGLATASEFHQIVTSKGELSKQLNAYAAQLAAEKFAGRPLDKWPGNFHTDRGHALEPDARAAYAILNDVEMTTTGFVTNFGAGASPDALIGPDGLCEIKSLAAKGHVLVLDFYHRNKRPPADYFAQAMGQMLICERAWCDLFFYSDVLPMLTVRLNRDDKFLGALKAAIDAVNAERDRFIGVLEAA